MTSRCAEDGWEAAALQGGAGQELLCSESLPLGDDVPLHAHHLKSNNPYRQQQNASKTALMRSTSQETDISTCGARKNAPVRAVFHDLHTAHSSITSGTARNKYRDLSNNLSEIFDDEAPILLKDLNPAARTDDYLENLPLPLPPAVISTHRYDGPPTDGPVVLDGEQVPGRLSRHIQAESLAQPTSMFSSIKRALVSMSSPSTTNDKSNTLTPTQWLKNSFEFSENDKIQLRGRSLIRNAKGNSQADPENKAQEIGSEEGKEPQSSRVCSRDISSIYHSNLGDPPSSSLPSSSQRDGNDELASHPGPDHAIRSKGFGSYNEALRFQDVESNSDSRPREQSPAFPRHVSKFGAQSSGGSSLPDGSTVGNIYKHYVGSRSDDGESEFDLPSLNNRNYTGRPLDSQSGVSSHRAKDWLNPSALEIRKQRRADKVVAYPFGQPPKFGLPNAPSTTPQRVALGSLPALGQLSSYGDANNLLEITQPSHWTGLRPTLKRSNGRSDLRSDHVSPELVDSSPSTQLTTTTNSPFRNIFGPQVVVSRPADGGALDGGSIRGMPNREPLEREVSDALRRISAYSDGSLYSQYPDYQSELPSFESIDALRREQIEDNPLSEVGSTEGESLHGGKQMQAFYNQGAIAPSWINSQQNNAIRVPINHTGAFSDPPPHSPPRKNQALQAQHTHRVSQDVEDDGNDWETVGDSALGGDNKSSNEMGMLGGTVNRAGSSIANTSDDGSASTFIPELERYGSTERFIQHPGNIQYHGDYRLRDLKQTNTPVFLPEFREHRVNGYLADSNRTRPPVNLFNHSPRPLGASHANPFISAPPEVMPKREPISSPSQRAYNPHEPDTIATTESGLTEDSMRDLPCPSRVIRRSKEAKGRREFPNWMDDFTDPGPILRNVEQSHRRLRTEDRPSSFSSFEHVMILARGDTIPGYNSDGSRKGSTSKDGSTNNTHGRRTGSGVVDRNTERIDRGRRNPKDHGPLVKGPPGAFYQGLRPGRGGGQIQNYERPSSRRNKNKPAYPTNTMRPLSLLEAQRVSTHIGLDGQEPHRKGPGNDFAYRSPLAPPKRKSSQWLYRKSQLIGFKEAAKADGYEMTILSSGDITMQSLEINATRSHVFEVPRLPTWSREILTTDPCRQRKKLSITVLCLCNLFPPLLPLFALGKLDCIVARHTGGKITKFGKGQKRSASILSVCWASVILLTIVAFLIYWFGARRNTV